MTTNHERLGRLVKLGHHVSRLAADIAERMGQLSVKAASPELVREVTAGWSRRLNDAHEEIAAIRGDLLPDKEGDDAE